MTFETEKPWRAKVIVALGVGLLVVGAPLGGEFALRHREARRPTLSGTIPTLFYRHGRLGHALVRGFDYFGRIHIDRDGFRGGEVSATKASGTVRVMAIGSSTTFDPSVSGDAAAWPARLQGELNKLLPGRPTEVINAGVPGYHVIEDLIRLETELFRYRPDVVILYEGHNDLFGALRRGGDQTGSATDTPDEVPVVTPWGHWLSRHSLLYGKLVARLKILHFRAAGQRALSGSRDSRPSADPVIDLGARQFERDLTSFLAVARGLGMRVVIPELVQVSGVGAVEEHDSTLVRAWSLTVPFARPETVLQGYVRYNSVLHDVADRFGATWVPTASFGLAGPAWYATDDPIHFNDRGAGRMAERLARALIASRALDLPLGPALGLRGLRDARTGL